MRKAFLIISILSLSLTSSCKKDDKNEFSNDDKQENIKKVNDLFSFGKIHRGAFTERDKYFKYDISLDAVNISDNIFEKTIVQADLELVLQNGNILTAKDSDHMFNIGSIEIFTFWKPKVTKAIGKDKELYTPSLPKHFKEYPVKQAVLVLELTAKDVVNNTEEIIVHNIDITEDWKSFVSKKTVKKKTDNNQNTTNKNTQTSTTTANRVNSSTNDLLSSSNNTKGTSTTSGETDGTSGQQGRLDGDPYSISRFSSRRSEAGNGSGWGLNGRSLVSHNVYRQDCNESGTVVIEVTVNKSGSVTNAKLSLAGTTNTAKCLVGAAIKTANTFKWRADNNAPDQQIGFVVINFRVG